MVRAEGGGEEVDDLSTGGLGGDNAGGWCGSVAQVVFHVIQEGFQGLDGVVAGALRGRNLGDGGEALVGLAILCEGEEDFGTGRGGRCGGGDIGRLGSGFCGEDGRTGRLAHTGEENVVADEAGIFRRDLGSAGAADDSRAGALEDLLDAEAGGLQVLEEFLGEETVFSIAVKGDLPGVGGEGDE